MLPKRWAHDEFTCAVCHRKVGEKLGDISSIQVGREKWCLKCGVRAERNGAGAHGPSIAVWDEKELRK